MLNVHELENNPFFHKASYKKNEVIFNEGETNNNLYIIIKGQLLVEKDISPEVPGAKELATLHPGDIFGEGSLVETIEKQVKVKAMKDSTVLFIDVLQDMKKCMEQFPLLVFEILKKVIVLSHERLMASDREATVNYEITTLINSIDKIEVKTLAFLFDTILQIYGSDYLLYLEKKEFIEHTLVIRYDTRSPGKFQDTVITFPDDFKNDILEQHGINVGKNSLIQKISIGGVLLGYIIFGNKEQDFTDSDKRNAQSIANNLVGILRQKKLLDEERDKDYLKNSM